MKSTTRSVALLAVALVLAAAAPLAAVEVELTVTESAGVARTNEPVTTGIPFARGELKDVKSLQLLGPDGKAMPAQFRALAPWPDGSVRVALLDTQVSVAANGSVKLKLTGGGGQARLNINGQQVIVQGGGAANVRVQVQVQGGNGQAQQVVIINGQPVAGDLPPVIAGVAGANAIHYDDGPGSIEVSTGPLTFRVSKKAFNLFESVKLNGKEILGPGTRIVLTTADGKQVATADAAPDEVKLEEVGDLRAVVLARGKFAGLHNGLLSYTCRITAWAGQPRVKVAFWLQNDGAYGYASRPEAFQFDGLSLELPVAGAKAVKFGDASAAKLEVKQDNTAGTGSPKSFGFTADADGQQTTGQQTDGRVTVLGGEAAMSAAVRWFWQQYPKAVRFDNGTLSLDLWPTWGHWPRQTGGMTGHDKSVPEKADLYTLPGAVRKRHEMMLDFAPVGQPTAPTATAAALEAPLMAMPSSAYAAGTEAFGTFAPGDAAPADAKAAEDVKKWNQWARNCADPASGKGIQAARETCRYGPFYGWTDFGDLFWAEGCCSLHYDWTWVMALDYVRLGDRYFFDRTAEMAEHRIDVDQIWSDREAVFFRGLTRYEKGFSNIHGGAKDGWYKPITSHVWVRGVVWYYYLTGDESARECALRTAMGVKIRQVAAHEKEGERLNDQTRASSWAIAILCDVYDMTGDKQYLDQAMTLWNNHLKALWKEKGDPSFGMRGGNSLQFFYPAQPLCLLHMRSGDKELLDYIRAAAAWTANEDNWKGMAYHDDMASQLNNYFGYLAVVDKDPKQLDEARKLFVRGMEKDNRLSLYAGSGAYTKEVCKKLRNGHIWLWAEWKLAGGK
ncbi:MAG: hypothetical protein BIFFINMI_04149 [Phycisphaerae bacterium]|nr:hypothetical protein [Phycisphaerae bacterium]